jgi:hypothetical protein
MVASNPFSLVAAESRALTSSNDTAAWKGSPSCDARKSRYGPREWIVVTPSRSLTATSRPAATPSDHRRRRIALTALDPAHVHPIDSSSSGQAILGDALGPGGTPGPPWQSAPEGPIP